jgi:hypothetical protein
LDDLGLVNFNVQGLALKELPRQLEIDYMGHRFAVSIPEDRRSEIPIGQVLFTMIGRQLFPLCNAKMNQEFMAYVITTWGNYGIGVTKV